MFSFWTQFKGEQEVTSKGNALSKQTSDLCLLKQYLNSDSSSLTQKLSQKSDSLQFELLANLQMLCSRAEITLWYHFLLLHKKTSQLFISSTDFIKICFLSKNSFVSLKFVTGRSFSRIKSRRFSTIKLKCIFDLYVKTGFLCSFVFTWSLCIQFNHPMILQNCFK